MLRALLTGGDRLHHAPARPLPFCLVNQSTLLQVFSGRHSVKIRRNQ